MRTLILFALFATLMVTVYAARLPHDDKVSSESLGGEAESRSKITDFTKQLSGTIQRYYNEGRQQFSTIVSKAGDQINNIRKTSGEQINKATQGILKTVDNVRSSITGSKSKPESPKTETPTALGN